MIKQGLEGHLHVGCGQNIISVCLMVALKVPHTWVSVTLSGQLVSVGCI